MVRPLLKLIHWGWNGTLWAQLSKRRAEEFLRQSGQFDSRYYLRQYADVAASGADPVWHYVFFGADEGRNPCAWFDTKFYRAVNRDALHASANPFWHYLKFGRAAGRLPSAGRSAPGAVAPAPSDSPLRIMVGEFLVDLDAPDGLSPEGRAVRVRTGETVRISGSCQHVVRHVLTAVLRLGSTEFECALIPLSQRGRRRWAAAAKRPDYRFFVEIVPQLRGIREVALQVALDDGTSLMVRLGALEVLHPRPELDTAVDRANPAGLVQRHEPAELNHDASPNRQHEELHSMGVHVIGYLGYNFGVAQAPRAVIRALGRAGIPYTTFNIASSIHDPVALEDLSDASWNAAENSPFPTHWLFVNAHEMVHVIQRRMPYLLGGRHNLATFWWEFDDHLQGEPEAFERLHHIVVFSDFIGTAVSKAAPGNVRVQKLPYPFTLMGLPDARHIPADVRTATRLSYKLNGDDFVFFFNFDTLSVVERKNPGGLLEAFALAFEGERSAKLVLKALHGVAGEGELIALREKSAQLGVSDQVLFIHENLSRTDFLRLLAASDAYVSLHRSEGLGLGLAEAMLLGKPAIATRYGGNLEFMNDANSLLVDYRLTALREDQGPYRKGWKWAQPDMDHAVTCMRALFNDRELAERLGQAGHVHIEREFSADRFVSALDKFTAQWR